MERERERERERGREGKRERERGKEGRASELVLGRAATLLAGKNIFWLIKV